MSFQLSPLWASTDETVHMTTNFTDVRMAVNFTDNFGEFLENRTYIDLPADQLVTGHNVIYN